MAQLVGQACVVCHERIGSVLDSHFCPACGCPVHAACAGAGKPDGTCMGCGAPAAEVARWVEAAKREAARESSRRADTEPLRPVVVLRYAIGVLLFGGFVVFIPPTLLALVVVTNAANPGNPSGLANFGLTCAAILGPPGYFAFPYRRRLQAVGWLSLACMGYTLLIAGLLTLVKVEPRLAGSPEGRAFIRNETIHYDRLAAITAVQLVTWAALFRRRRGGAAEPRAAPYRRSARQSPAEIPESGTVRGEPPLAGAVPTLHRDEPAGIHPEPGPPGHWVGLLLKLCLLLLAASLLAMLTR